MQGHLNVLDSCFDDDIWKFIRRNIPTNGDCITASSLDFFNDFFRFRYVEAMRFGSFVFRSGKVKERYLLADNDFCAFLSKKKCGTSTYSLCGT